MIPNYSGLQQLMYIKAGVLTISDKGAAGERDDRSGAQVKEILGHISAKVVSYQIVPDDKSRIQQALLEMTDQLKLDLVVTTGGTGLGVRDVTPEATAELLERTIPGMAEAMRWEGLQKTPHAMLSRGLCGSRGGSLIVNLPGSPKAVVECLEVILPALPHAISLLRGSREECGHPVI